ncbi:MAG: ATP-binding protein [Microthrixaceae bacterium]
MSHELRTPLNAVLGFAQLLEMDLEDGSDLESVRHIITAGGHLLELIDDVLDLARIDSGDLEVSVQEVELHPLAMECLELIRPVADRSGVAVEVDEDCGVHTVLADRQRLRQVLLNLLSNAIKFNVEGGSVVVGCTGHGERVEVSITDTGCGIAVEDLERLFTPYERLDAAERGIEGTGLGLALSKRLCDAMGAGLSLAPAEAAGCTATVSLRAAEAAPAREGAAEEHRAGSSVGDSLEGTVLHIEDNATNARLVAHALSHHPSIELIEARTAAAGLDLALEHLPDVILLDLHLPDANGSQVIDRLRLDERTAGIPVVVISADANPEEVERLTEAGALDYLTKPIDVRRLLDVMARAIAGTGTAGISRAGLPPT